MFVGITVLVLCFVCVGSWSFGVVIALRLYCWIPESVRKVLKSFEQPGGPVGKPNHLFHWVKFSKTAAWVVYLVG